MRPRHPLRILARLLGWPAPPPTPKRKVYEHVDQLGYHTREPRPAPSMNRFAQDAYAKWVQELPEA